MDKGKGKLPLKENGSESSERTPSFLERLEESARGLARDAVVPGRSQITADLQEATAGSNKGGSFTSSARPSASGQTLLEDTVSSTSSVQRGPTSNIRSTTRTEGGNAEFNLDQWSRQRDEGVPLAQPTSTGKGVDPDQDHHLHASQTDQATMQSAWDNVRQDRNLSHNTATGLTDGAEVVNMLSDPSFQPEIWGDEDFENEGKPLTISAEERAISDRFLQATQDQTRQELAASFAQSLQLDSSNGSSQQTLSFFDDIHNYHEDVWGFLEPIVEQARSEIRNGLSVGESPAVARLQMILGHIDPSRFR